MPPQPDGKSAAGKAAQCRGFEVRYMTDIIRGRTSKPKRHWESISCQCPSIPKFAKARYRDHANFGSGHWRGICRRMSEGHTAGPARPRKTQIVVVGGGAAGLELAT